MSLRVCGGASFMQGRRPKQEDRHVLAEDGTSVVGGDKREGVKRRLGVQPVSLFGLFDGHQGSLASDWCAQHLPKQILLDISKEIPNDNNITPNSSSITSEDNAAAVSISKPNSSTAQTCSSTDTNATASSFTTATLSLTSSSSSCLSSSSSYSCDASSSSSSSSSSVPSLCCSSFPSSAVPTVLDLSSSTISELIGKSFLKVDNSFLNKYRVSRDGCTAVLALLLGSRLFVAGVGDSRAVLGTAGGRWRRVGSTVQEAQGGAGAKERGFAACRLTEDHKPDRPDEKARIESNGGRVVCIGGVHRVAPADYEARVKRIKLSTCTTGGSSERPPVLLAVSRAIGDRELKLAGCRLLSAAPEITWFDVDPFKHRFICMACDGVWDVLTDQEVVNIVASHGGSAEDASSAVILSAFRRGSQVVFIA
eukprot:GHVS01080572.1.p1 GENE.GHVS01080572.1~~GHVS01080572.1.p1  ORF type:complete len:423 (-),score=96.87 GHVS01080572.1:245-1513(-)